MAQKQEAPQGERSHASQAKGYPRDRFDDLPNSGRTGAHRVTALPRYAWLYVMGALVGAALLTTVGVLGVNLANSSGSLPLLPSQEPVEPEAPKVTPLLDPAATVVILDGTSPTGEMALRLDPVITQEQWGIITAAGPAASTDVEISAVFYADPADEAAAMGLAQKLGGLSAYQSSEYAESGARLVVLLGSDYAGPGATADAG